ncbi:MAG: type II secretion system protein [Eubacteriales bacterium]|jgi:prepilin-type N-terminal cleavage/methylation domain-containing protein|nr:type II secretion system protein [Eubacteriales bacterium]MDD4717381.1 type II secretion system protein [Eubacteriales bacterium]
MIGEKLKKYIVYNSKSGLTLVEVMVSIMILSVIVVAFFPLFSYTSRIVRKSETLVDASYVAQSVLEEYYRMSKDEDSALPADSVTISDDAFGKGYRVVTQTIADGKLVKVRVKVFSDETEKLLESQMELHLIWH